MPRFISTWMGVIVLAAFAMFGVANLAGQETVPGERVNPSTYGRSYVESMEAVLERDRLAPPMPEQKERRGQPGVWAVPTPQATTKPHSGMHNVVNKWGDTHMGIGFPAPVNVEGAWFSGQAATGVWAPSIRVIGYRSGKEVARTDWFNNIGPQPDWFPMNLSGVDRIVISAAPAFDNAAWYAMDDLTYSVNGIKTVVNFDDLSYGTTLSGTGYAGLTWETGPGGITDDGIHGPMAPPGTPPIGAPTEEGAAARSAMLAAAPSVVSSFQGSIRGDAGQYSFPPDTIGAIGPDHFVVVVNTIFAVFDRESGARLVNVSLDSFLPGSSGDPRVLFDQHSGRWIVTVDDFNSRCYIAVSTSSSATGSWFKTNFVMSQGDDAGRWPDYPTLGVDENGIYVSAFMVGGFGQMSIFALDKAPLISSPPALGTVTAFRNLPWEAAIQPAHTFGTAPGEYCISTVDSTHLRLRRVNPPLTAPTLTNLGTLTVPSYSEPPDAPALECVTPLDTVGSRLIMAVYRSGSLWTCHTISASGRAACRWYEITPASVHLEQSGTVSDSSLHYFFPSIMVNEYGSALMAFTGSDSSHYASCYVTGRLQSDPAGNMATPIEYHPGAAPQNLIDGYGRNRFGDYSYTTLDPNDQGTFWTIQEYGHADNIWGTYVAQLTLHDGDCNGNGIPDLCDIDCGPAGDTCDVPGCGGSLDCNGNGTPDECETDCNGNGIPDDCDLAAGSSPDCNGNGIPDECDVASGYSQDCQPNGIPDECDLLPPDDVPAHDNCIEAELICPHIVFYGTTVGATTDGSATCGSSSSTPDVWYYYEPAGNGFATFSLAGSTYDTVLSIHSGCPGTTANELACNDNYSGLQSAIQNLFVDSGNQYWIRISGADGATGNFQLLISGPQCNYTAGDCNGNDVPDECDIASGLSQDCNANGIPDECDIASGASLDANRNGVPDECESGLLGDLNCDGLVNAFDIDPFVLALTDPAAYQAAHPDCQLMNADINGDGLVNAFDIDPFVVLLTGG
jgi:hypothetical protein